MIENPISSQNNPFKTAQELSRPLVLDGAMGSYLQQKGFIRDDKLWMTKLITTNPEEIIKVHKEYIEAGADIITTNTFRTNPSAFESSGSSYQYKYVKQAVDLAESSIADREILIAGSNAPAEDCYQRERTLSYNKLEINHKKHIDLLIDSNVDFILNETQSHFDEIKIICRHCSQSKIPFVMSLYLDNSTRILSGESFNEIISFILEYAPFAIGINCISPEVFKNILAVEHFNFCWGFYLNCGSGLPTDRNIDCAVSPNEYREFIKKSLPLNPSFIGSCCGSNPSHIKIIREFLDGKNSN